MTAPLAHMDFSKIKYLLTDSRNLRQAESSLFFCLDGKGRSGCDYVEELYAKGVRHFVVPTGYRSNLKAHFTACQNPIDLLHGIAFQHRSSFAGQMLAITGSNGKTVVKEWLFRLLNKHRFTFRSPQSYNSQIGVPLSLWEIPLSCQTAIIEAGISQKNEMGRLARIVQAEFGIFTNLGHAHQENFNSLEEKAAEKLKLFASCKAIIYRKDQRLLDDLIKKTHPTKQLITWSFEDRKAPYYLLYDKEKQSLHLHQKQKHLHSYPFPFNDAASLENIGHCLVAALTLGIPPEDLDISNMEAIEMRLEQKQGIKGCHLISDAYNSDVLSLRIALDTLRQVAQSKQQRQTVFLSDIEQSGVSAEVLYREIADLLQEQKVFRLIGIGAEMYKYRDKFCARQQTFYNTTEDCLKALSPTSFSGETVLFKGARSFRFERIIRLLEDRRHQTILEIDLNALRENFNYFKGLLKPQTKIMGMVKAFAYGSGASEVARILQQQGCNYLAVAVADEGVELRKSKIKLPIVVMTPERNSFEIMLNHGLEPAIYSFKVLDDFLNVAKKAKTDQFPIHLKFDTGMHRLGFTLKDVDKLLKIIKGQMWFKPTSVFSHLSAADEQEQDDFTLMQIRTFEEIAQKIEQKLGYPLIKHILNSAGTERFSSHQNDMVRLGIGMYGISVTGHKLQEISTLKTAITQIRSLPKEETVGYGRKGKLHRAGRIATLPIGYADGVQRARGNDVGHVIINGQKAPFIGNICMDLSMVDITGLEAQEGDEVILMGNDIDIQTIAKQIRSIPYEVLTSISQRVKRVYIE